MNLNLAGKKVLVTGSSRGIGLQIARHFSVEGCSVALNGRTNMPSDVIGTVSGSISVIGDVSNELGAKKVIKESVKRLDGLDIVICNVGSGRSVKPGKENIKAWKNRNKFVFIYSIENFENHEKNLLVFKRAQRRVSQGVCCGLPSKFLKKLCMSRENLNENNNLP